MLDISKLRLTQPSLAGSGAELGNIQALALAFDWLRVGNILRVVTFCLKHSNSSYALLVHLTSSFKRQMATT